MDKELEELTRIYAEKYNRLHELSVKTGEARKIHDELVKASGVASYELGQARDKLLYHLHGGKHISAFDL